MRIWPFLTFAILPGIGWLALPLIARLPAAKWQTVARPFALFIAIASTLLLVLRLPTGSIDISDLWQFLGWALLPSVLLLGLRLSRHIQTRWVRTVARAAGSLLLVPLGFFFLLLCLVQSGCVRHAAPLYSPDGQYIVVWQVVMAGALGDDYCNVAVRRNWWPIAERAYRGVGRWDERQQQVSYPEVRWLDRSRLLIRYREDSAHAMCKENVGAVQVICENLLAADPVR